MNTALATFTIILLTTRSRRPRGWWALPAALLVTNCAGRLLVAHHWLTDVVGGLLAALALAGLALPAFRSHPVLAPSVVMLALGAVLSIDLGMRALEIRLPSPLSTPREALAQATTGAALGTTTMQGSWQAGTEGIRGLPPAALLHGSGMVTLEVPGRNDLDGRARNTVLEPGAITTLVVAGRPDATVPGCGRLQVTVNGTMLRAFVPFVGWREYRLIVPADVIHPGRNEVRIDFADDSGVPRAFAIDYLRIVSR